jgi:acyl-CoA thioester hydrolase
MARTASPLATGGRIVPPEWIDYNGHMMDGYYAVAFSAATDALLDYLGLGEDYRVAGECGMYTVESHICYRRSVLAGTVLRFQSRLLGCDAKRLHAFHEMRDAADDTVTATNEVMMLHVRTDRDGERVAPMPPELLNATIRLAAAHAELAAPPNAGRPIRLRLPYFPKPTAASDERGAATAFPSWWSHSPAPRTRRLPRGPSIAGHQPGADNDDIGASGRPVAGVGHVVTPSPY